MGLFRRRNPFIGDLAPVRKGVCNPYITFGA